MNYSEEISSIIVIEGSNSEVKKYSNIYGENQNLLEINTGDRTIKSPLIPRTEFGEILSNTIKKANRVNHIMKVAMEEHIPLREIVEQSDNPPKWNRSDWNNYPKLTGEPLLENTMLDLPNSTLGTLSTMVFRTRIAQMIHSLTGIPLTLATVHTEEIIETIFGITYTFQNINGWRKRTNMDTFNGSSDHMIPLTNLLNRTSLCDALELTRLLGTDGHCLWQAPDIWMRTAICSQEGRTKIFDVQQRHMD